MKSKFIALSFFIVGCLAQDTINDINLAELQDHDLFTGLEMGISRDNYSCPDFDLGSLCDTDCRVDYIGCRQECSELACENECTFEYAECVAACPCGINCPDGCADCLHPLCEISPCENIEDNYDFKRCETINKNEFTQCVSGCTGVAYSCYEECSLTYLDNMKRCPCYELCPQGCPFCPEYQCEPDDIFTAIYLVSSGLNYNYSEIYSIDGTYKQTAYYNYEDVYNGQSEYYQGIMYLFGGRNRLSIDKIDGCQIVPLSIQLVKDVGINAPSLSIQNQGVYTCFYSDSYNWCQLFDGESVRLIDHRAERDKDKSCMAEYNGKPAAIGGDGGRMVEILGPTGWYDQGEHPSDTRYAACLTVGSAMITIGGNGDRTALYSYSDINSEWKYLGSLQKEHYYNSAMYINGFIISSFGYDQDTRGIERIEIIGEEFSSEIFIEEQKIYDYKKPIFLISHQYDCTEQIEK